MGRKYALSQRLQEPKCAGLVGSGYRERYLLKRFQSLGLPTPLYIPYRMNPQFYHYKQGCWESAIYNVADLVACTFFCSAFKRECLPRKYPPQSSGIVIPGKWFPNLGPLKINRGSTFQRKQGIMF